MGVDTEKVSEASTDGKLDPGGPSRSRRARPAPPGRVRPSGAVARSGTGTGGESGVLWGNVREAWRVVLGVHASTAGDEADGVVPAAQQHEIEELGIREHVEQA